MLSQVVQNIRNMEYAWYKPQTYLACVPGISLIIQKIQYANLLPIHSDIHSLTIRANVEKNRQFFNVNKWHLRGALTQHLLSVVLIKVFAAHFFGLAVFVFSAYQIIDIAIKSVNNPVALCSEDGSRVEYITPFTIF